MNSQSALGILPLAMPKGPIISLSGLAGVADSHSVVCLGLTDWLADQCSACLASRRGRASVEAQSAPQSCLPVPGTGGEDPLQRVRTGPWTRRRYTLRRKETQVSPRMYARPGSGAGCFEMAAAGCVSQRGGRWSRLPCRWVCRQTIEALVAIYWCGLPCRQAAPVASNCTFTSRLKVWGCIPSVRWNLNATRSDVFDSKWGVYGDEVSWWWRRGAVGLYPSHCLIQGPQGLTPTEERARPTC